MEEVQGDRGKLFILDNCIYKINRHVNGDCYYTCKTDGCYSRATQSNGEIISRSPHNHEPEDLEVEKIHFREELRQLASSNILELSPRQIYDRVCERFPRVARQVTYQDMRSFVCRHRSRGVPPIPHSLEALSTTFLSERWAHLNSLLDDPENRPFHRQLLGGEEMGWSAAVYVSSRLAGALGGTQRLHVDATFKILPQELNAHQLLTIHAEHMNYLFPVVFAIMDRKTQQVYHGVFSYTSSIVPEWDPVTIMSDFEAAMSNAAKIVWPGAEIKGCFFHYSQAIYRMHGKLHMQLLTETNLEAGWALHMLMALALLPAGRIVAGLGVVTHYVSQHHLANQFSVLLGYMQHQWVQTVGPATMSVNQQVHRTNNALESFYSALVKRMGPRPGMWDFQRHLRRKELAQWRDLERLSNGIHNIRPRRRVYVQQDINIHDAQGQLNMGRYNEAQFLHRMAHCTKTLVDSLRGNRPRRRIGAAVANAASSSASSGNTSYAATGAQPDWTCTIACSSSCACSTHAMG